MLIAQCIGESVFYYLHNAHGDVTQRIAADGTAAKRYKYDAFGNQLRVPGQRELDIEADPNPFCYCGEYFDTETSEIYLRARYYDPSTGRFTSEDPAKDGGNWYNYCGNDPIKNVDPTGTVFYIFAQSGRQEEAELVAAQLREEYGYDVEIVTSDTEKQFVDGWNGMGHREIGRKGRKTIEEEFPIDGVIIIMHGNSSGISAGEDEKREGIDTSKLNNDRHIPVIIMLSCNTGKTPRKGKNIAQWFLDHTNTDMVIAPSKFHGIRSKGGTQTGEWDPENGWGPINGEYRVFRRGSNGYSSLDQSYYPSVIDLLEAAKKRKQSLDIYNNHKGKFSVSID